MVKQKLKREQLRCVYIIKNVKNDKFYIGSTTDFYRRYKEHFWYLRNGVHYNINLQTEFDEFGEDAFTYEILEVVGNKEELLIREQHHVDELKPPYNIMMIVDRPTGVKRRDETKEKVRQANLGLVHPEWRNEIKSKAQGGENHWTKKKKFTPEAKKKMSDTKKKMYEDGYVNPMKGKKLPQETLDKIRTKLSKPILQLSLDSKLVREWGSINEAARELNLDKSCISMCCRGKRKTHGGFTWSFKNE